MPKIYYLATRPETLMTLLIRGTLPENLKDAHPYIDQESLELFATPETASSHSNASTKNTYILKCEFPDSTATYDIIYQSSSSSDSSAKIITKSVDPKSIKEIYAYNQTAKNVIDRLTNLACPVSIVVKPDIYSSSALVMKSDKLDEKVATPTSLVTILKTGDILGSKMQAIINTINCVGVMGKGIAYSFKNRYPEMFKDYHKKCKNKEVVLGKPYIYPLPNGRLIINFPTKDHWKNNSKLKDIENGLKYLASKISEWKITSLAIPPLGCGNGGLAWENVKPLIITYLKPLNIPLEIYEPFIDFKKPNKTSTPSSVSKETKEGTSIEAKQLYSFFNVPKPTHKPTTIEVAPKKRKRAEDDINTPSDGAAAS